MARYEDETDIPIDWRFEDQESGSDESLSITIAFDGTMTGSYQVTARAQLGRMIIIPPSLGIYQYYY
jgi:hypothetical protein